MTLDLVSVPVRSTRGDIYFVDLAAGQSRKDLGINRLTPNSTWIVDWRGPWYLPPQSLATHHWRARNGSQDDAKSVTCDYVYSYDVGERCVPQPLSRHEWSIVVWDDPPSAHFEEIRSLLPQVSESDTALIDLDEIRIALDTEGWTLTAAPGRWRWASFDMRNAERRA